MNQQHSYSIALKWTGNKGRGTQSYNSYQRSYDIMVADKPILQGSSDPAFLGDRTKYNPEELLLAAISSCHMLWYLHLCANAKIVVLNYSDNATAVMQEYENGSGKFTAVTLNPIVTIGDISQKDLAEKLHQNANEMCFIANSLNFKIQHKSIVMAKQS